MFFLNEHFIYFGREMWNVLILKISLVKISWIMFQSLLLAIDSIYNGGE